jgi:hypothetical protein
MKSQGKKRLLLSDDQRRLLAVKGKSLGRKALMELTTIVTPDTILRWHRTLVANKWNYSDRKKRQPGRPPIRQVIVDLILRVATENPAWGYDRIQGALANVGYHISDQTVGNVLKAHGIEPAPDRKRQTTWKTSSHIGTSWPLSISRPLKSGRKEGLLSALRDGARPLKASSSANLAVSGEFCRIHVLAYRSPQHRKALFTRSNSTSAICGDDRQRPASPPVALPGLRSFTTDRIPGAACVATRRPDPWLNTDAPSGACQ